MARSNKPAGLLPLNAPQPLAVDATDGGRPLAVQQRGRMVPVTAIRDQWRIDDEWWRTAPISRRYIVVELGNGRVLTIYQDLVTGEWFQQSYQAPR